MRKQRQRVCPDHSAGKWQVWDLNQGGLAPESIFSTDQACYCKDITS